MVVRFASFSLLIFSLITTSSAFAATLEYTCTRKQLYRVPKTTDTTTVSFPVSGSVNLNHRIQSRRMSYYLGEQVTEIEGLDTKGQPAKIRFKINFITKENRRRNLRTTRITAVSGIIKQFESQEYLSQSIRGKQYYSSSTDEAVSELQFEAVRPRLSLICNANVKF